MTRVKHSQEVAAHIEKELHHKQKRSQEQIVQLKDLIKAIRQGKIQQNIIYTLDTSSLEHDAQVFLARQVAKEQAGLLPRDLDQALQKDPVSIKDLQKALLLLLKPKKQITTKDQYSSKQVNKVPWDRYAPGALTKTIQRQKGIGQLALRMQESQSSQAKETGFKKPILLNQEGLSRFTPLQQKAIMAALFGTVHGNVLSKLGCKDLSGFMNKMEHMEGRQMLASLLSIQRAGFIEKLLGLEMLTIGPGRNGEQGLSPELLKVLARGGVFSLQTLAALKGLTRNEFQYFFQLMRYGPMAFRLSMNGHRPILKKDLQHWSNKASRLKSKFSLPALLGDDWDIDNAAEHLQRWYLDYLFYEELEFYQRNENQEHGNHHGFEEEWEESEEWDQPAYDENSPDQLVCFWIEEHNLSPRRLGGIRRRYVCINTQTGAIIPQYVEGGDI